MSALTDVFTAIANAIRSKKGVSTTYKPSQMADAISSINGEYTVYKDLTFNISQLDSPRDFYILDLENRAQLKDIADYLYLKYKSNLGSYKEIYIPTTSINNNIYITLCGVGTSTKGTHNYAEYDRLCIIVHDTSYNRLWFVIYGPARLSVNAASQDGDTSIDAAIPVRAALLRTKNITLYNP